MSIHSIDYLFLWVKWKTSSESLSIYRPRCNQGLVGWFESLGTVDGSDKRLHVGTIVTSTAPSL